MVSLSTSAIYYSVSPSPTFVTTTSRLVSVSIVSAAARCRSIRVRAFLNKPSSTAVVQTTLRLLDWDKLSDSIASFAGTSFGREATKAQLWDLNRTYSESVKLLEETNAAVEMHTYGTCLMDFTCLRMELVKSAIQQARRSLPVTGSEAMAILALLQFAEALQFNLKSAIKEDADWLQRFMPVADVILELVISRPLMKLISQLIDEDGAVKDSASPALKRSRDQVRLLERKLYQLMDSLVRNEQTSLEVSNVGGRWCCIQSGADMQTSFEGLLLSSGSSSGSGSILEPLAAVPLNDELQQAKASVTQAESDVLLSITNKMQVDLDDVENLFRNIVLLDVINARARYGLSYGGTYPDLYLPEDTSSTSSITSLRKWKLYLPKAFHPLLLQQHRQALQEAIENANNATNEIRRRRQQGQSAFEIEEANSSVSSLQMEVARLKESPPIPIDIFVGEKTRVVVISGPNTGGKTICLKTLGLAALMAKSGVYVLSSEPVKIPWFDSVFADIGDEQSLSQSLSTFSAHLKQTGEILSHSTTRSLVLLDEVGAGTNPVEGAGLGMSLLESFAESGVLLTMATTHHGELKTLKYSNNAFENACMEFDEVKLKPTYKILWGVPGRSNAMNIAKRLGVPGVILKNARELYGDASAEINEVIVEMEKFKREIEEHAYESQHYLKVSREVYKSVVEGRMAVMEHGRKERYKKIQQISESASGARSFLHNKLRQVRATAAIIPTPTAAATQQTTTTTTSGGSGSGSGSDILQVPTNSTTQINPPPSSAAAAAGGVGGGLPKVGDTVHVTSLNKKATVIKVEPSKQQITVQAGFMRLKLNLADVLT